MARKKYREAFKAQIVRLVRQGGLSGNKVAKEHNLAQATVARWVRDAIALEVPRAMTREERTELKALRKENRRLKEDREIQKKSRCLLSIGIVNVYRFILEKKDGPIFSTHRLRDLFRVSRSAMYRWHRTRQQRVLRDAKMLVHIRANHRRSREMYGSPRTLADLRDTGIEVARSRVARIMCEKRHHMPPKEAFLEHHPVAPSPCVRVGDEPW